ncbi:hypothetical protein WLH_03145 [Escherichia coli O25b:H4]|uniref:Uncharacterized protein n=1 Tax=Escherichia coli O25b:H4 TaxID=941280 RepID=A0A192CFD2_ECO25|nr:hypothetical protein WLH_03145 [Escherichia coli O25b:H4]
MPLRFSQRRGVCIIRFPATESSIFLLFSVEILRRTPLTRRRVCRCSVSVVAHYRELFRPDKRKFKIIF